MSRIDDAVRRILRVKFRAGLFEHPYVDQAKADAASCSPDAAAAARKAAGPLDGAAQERAARRCRSSKSKKTAVIGPLGDDQHDMLGPWWGRGEDKDAVTVFQGIKAQNPRHDVHRRAARSSNTEPPDNTPADECGDDAGFARRGRGRQGGRPGRARARRVARAERRGRLAQRDRPARQAGGADPARSRRPASRSSSCCSTAAR